MDYYGMCVQQYSGALLVTYLLALGTCYGDLELLGLAAGLYLVFGGRYVAQ